MEPEHIEVEQDPPDECTCVLPEQSCPVCRAAARRIYQEDELEGVIRE